MLLFCELGSLIIYVFLSTPKGVVKKSKIFNENFTFTFLYLSLYLYIKCLNSYLDILVDFYVLEGKCRNFLDNLTLFRNTPRCWGGKQN